MLCLLDEECSFPQSSDSSFVQKLTKYCSQSDRYLPKPTGVEFGIQHYAGMVVYTVAGFLDKNKDTQQDQLFEMMHQSSNEFVQDLTRFQVSGGGRVGVDEWKQMGGSG